MQGYDYSSGVWQFEGYGFVPNGTTGTSIMQIHRFSGPATVLMLKVYDGQLKFYTRAVVESNIYDRWMRINVIHDVDANKLTVFIDGVQKFETDGNGQGSFDFKCVVYTQTEPSHYMESRWRNIRVLKKDEWRVWDLSYSSSYPVSVISVRARVFVVYDMKSFFSINV